LAPLIFRNQKAYKTFRKCPFLYNRNGAGKCFFVLVANAFEMGYRFLRVQHFTGG
jgi:hypothetical protein